MELLIHLDFPDQYHKRIVLGDQSPSIFSSEKIHNPLSPDNQHALYGAIPPVNNREGYWTGAHFSHQLNSILAIYETLHPDLQVVIEIDQSSCHLKRPEDGHYASGLNVGPGGREMKPSPPLTQECLGPGRKIVNIGDIQYYKYKADTELMMPLNNRGKKIKFNSKELLEGVNYGMVQILKNVGLMSVNSQEGRNW